MKWRFYLAIAVISAMPFSACRKGVDKDTAFAKLFKNTEWTGEIKYQKVSIAEPFSVQFLSDSEIVWHERRGTFLGSYTINADIRELTIEFASNAGKFTTTITNDNTFSHIAHGGSYDWEIKSGMINNSGKQNLDNTRWSTESGSNQFIFKPNKKVQVNSDPDQPYERAGCAIKKFTDGFSEYFIVTQPGNRIKVFEWVSLGAGLDGEWSYECIKR
jgi:hypothetical protein